VSGLPHDLTPASLRPLVEPRMKIDAAHDWGHVERVFHCGMAIAATEPDTDLLVLRAALVLHDIGEKTEGSGNRLVGESEVHEILLPFAVPAPALSRIVAAINEHSFTRGQQPATIEAAIVQDADRLDAIGAVGIGRAFAYGGALGRPLYDPEDRRSTIHHFYDKLLLLRDGMHTTEGRRLADARHAFLEQFLEQFLQEWAGC
jgi:uncharacterized protein